MKDELISFNTAKEAKEVGFNEPCNYYYDESGDLLRTKMGMHGRPNDFGGYYAAPSQSLLQKWFRDEHDIWIIVDFAYDTDKLSCYIQKGASDDFIDGFSIFDTYEESLEEGLEEACKNLKLTKWRK